MKNFTIEDWQNTLVKVYERAATDEPYRQLCLLDPRAAVAMVSEIEPPADFHFKFIVNPKEAFYSFLLPPLQVHGQPEENLHCLLEWSVYSSHPTWTH